MTLPQQRLPGTTYFITTRCERRECRLPPTEETSAAIGVAIAEAAERHQVRVVVASAPGNHLHMGVYDELGLVSEFMRDAHSVIARFGNARDDAKGYAFWNRQPPLAMVLGDAATVVQKVAYVMANPVTSFLVKRLEDWPGLKFEVGDLGRWRGPIYRRPKTFFRKNGWVSEEVQVSSELPPMVEAAYGIEGFQRRVKAAVESLVSAAHAEAEATGRGFVGVSELLRQSVWTRPGGPDPRREADGALRRLAAATKARLREMAAALVAFRRAHRVAWEAMRRGVRAVFPAGAFKAWRYYGAERADATFSWAGWSSTE